MYPRLEIEDGWTGFRLSVLMPALYPVEPKIKLLDCVCRSLGITLTYGMCLHARVGKRHYIMVTWSIGPSKSPTADNIAVL